MIKLKFLSTDDDDNSDNNARAMAIIRTFVTAN